jgi:hypothetical protein
MPGASSLIGAQQVARVELDAPDMARLPGQVR